MNDNLEISNIQQITLDSFRIDFVYDVTVEIAGSLRYTIATENGVDITSKFKTIQESNDWTFSEITDHIDVFIKQNESIEDGTYHIKVFNNNESFYEGNASIGYLEGIRLSLTQATQISNTTINIHFDPLSDPYEICQTPKFFKLLDMTLCRIGEDESVVSDTPGSNYVDRFNPIDIDSIANVPITDIQISLKDGKNLPSGKYNIIFTARIKDRTVSVYSNTFYFEYMTTSLPNISSVDTYVNSFDVNILAIRFAPYLNYQLINVVSSGEDGASFQICDANGRDITNHFDSLRVSSKYATTGGINLLTGIDVKLLETYTIERGTYTINFKFPEKYLTPDLSYTFNCKGIIKTFEYIGNDYLDKVRMRFNGKVAKDDIPNEHLEVLTSDGTDVSHLFGNLSGDKSWIGDAPGYDIYVAPFLQKANLPHGLLQFTVYHYDASNERVSDYTGSLDVVSNITPDVVSVEQSDFNKITVSLQKEQPITILESCDVKIIDSFSGTDFSSYVQSIRDSNVWDGYSTNANTFDILIKDNSVLNSGQYTFNIVFDGDDLSKHPLSLNHIETRHGVIDSIEQIDMSHIRISFTEPQTREFLIGMTLSVSGLVMIDGEVKESSYTDRFENLEIVLRNIDYQFTELVIPIAKEEYLPFGVYTFSFLYILGDSIESTVYTYGIELPFMTDMRPNIVNMNTYYDDKDMLTMTINFKPYIVSEYFDESIISFKDKDDNDILDRFQDRSEWNISYSIQEDARFVRAISFKIKNTSVRINKGKYDFVISWDNPMLENILYTASLDYILPMIKSIEAAAIDRLYLTFEEKLQYSYLEIVKLKVVNGFGVDCSDHFDTIQNANHISSETPEDQKLPTNNINIIILNPSGLYDNIHNIILYHMEDDIEVSDYIGKINIKTTTYPILQKITQTGVDSIRVDLKNISPVSIIKTMDFRVFDPVGYNITDMFQTIALSNNWGANILETTSFMLSLKSERHLERGMYQFCVYDDRSVISFIYAELTYMEGFNCVIRRITKKSLSELTIWFIEDQVPEAFRTLTLKVTNSNGTDVTDRFTPITETLDSYTDLFTSFPLKLADGCVLEKDSYTISFLFISDSGEITELTSKTIDIGFMTTIDPKIRAFYMETNDMDDKLLHIEFENPMERGLFDMSSFQFTDSNAIEMTDHFSDIKTSNIESEIIDNIEYITSIYLIFKENEFNLLRGIYRVTFSWTGDYSFIPAIYKEATLNYILYPLEDVEVTSISTLKLTLPKSVTREKFNQFKLTVQNMYVSTNSNSRVEYVDINFSDFFKDLIDTNPELVVNEGEEAITEEIRYINIELKDGKELPANEYTFVIENNDSTNDLEYVYAKKIYTGYMTSLSNLGNFERIKQTDINRVTFSFNKDICVDLIKDSEIRIVRESDDYLVTDLFLNPTDSNQSFDEEWYKERFTKQVYTEMFDVEEKHTINEDMETHVDTTITVEDVNYTFSKIIMFDLLLKEEKYIPKGNYKFELIKNDQILFSKSVYVGFMTSSLPQIIDMKIDTSALVVEFLPYVEKELLESSVYTLTNNQGKDVTQIFSSIAYSSRDNIEDNHIIFVYKIAFDILPDQILAGGEYEIRFTFPKESFLPDVTARRGLSVISKGIKSAMLSNYNTLHVILDEKRKAGYLKSLRLNVLNAETTDVTDLFKGIKDSNPSLTDDNAEINEFDIIVEDGASVPTNEYKFTLSHEMSGDPGEDIGNVIAYTILVNIVFMASELPTLDRVDNLSSDSFTVEKITDRLSHHYNGRTVQLLSSDLKEILTDDNRSNYVNQYAKVYDEPNTNELTFEFSDEVYPCLLNACNVSITNNEGEPFVDRFDTVRNSNEFKSRNVFSNIEITLEEPIEVDDLEECAIDVTTPSGDVMSFKKISDSGNDFPDEGKVSSFFIIPSEGELFEEYESIDISVSITKGDGTSISPEKFSYIVNMEKIDTVNKMKLNLFDDCDFLSDNYTIKMTYQNEPGMEGAKVIEAFSYSGLIPYLLKNIGNITSILVIGMDTLKIKFSNDLPVRLFESMKLSILNIDGIDYSESFSPVSESNTFDNITYISELSEPYTIYYRLSEGKRLSNGVYTFRYTMNVSSREDQSNNDMIQLFEYTTNLSYMIRESANSIKDIQQIDINKLQIELENGVDISVLKSFNLTAVNQNSNKKYDVFLDASASNQFGMMALLTSNKTILYSKDYTSWTNVAFPSDAKMNDICFDSNLGIFIVAASTGVYYTNDLENPNWEKMDNLYSSEDIQSFDDSINQIVKLCNGKDHVFAVDIDKRIFFLYKADNGDFVWTLCYDEDFFADTIVSTQATTKFTNMFYKEDVGYVVTGSNGTIITSENAIDHTKWNCTENIVNESLLDITYRNSYVNEDDVTIEVNKKGFYVSGTNGTLLYSQNGVAWEILTSGVKRTLTSIYAENGLIVAGGEGGTLIISSDGDTWNTVQGQISYNIKSLDYMDGRFYASLAGNTWASSSNGTSWITQSTTMSIDISRIVSLPLKYGNIKKAKSFNIKLKDNTDFGYEDTNVYTFYISSTSIKNKNSTLYQKSDVSIGYMTTNTGSVSSAEYIIPTKSEDTNYLVPYIKVDFQNGNANMLYYSTFTLINLDDNQEYTSCFVDINNGKITKNGKTLTSVLLWILSEKEEELPVSVNGYKLKWKWSPFNDNHTDIIEVENLNGSSNLIQSITQKMNGEKPIINSLTVKFTKGIESRYFNSSTNKPKIIFKRISTESNSNINYASYFKDLQLTNDFSNETISELYLELLNDNNKTLPSGNYIVRIYKESEEIPCIPQDDRIHYMSIQSDIPLLQADQPRITQVVLKNYLPTIEKKSGSPVQYTGNNEPSKDQITTNWIASGEQDQHVGDKYKNTLSGDTYTYVNELGIYYWKIDATKPYLCIIFSGYPCTEYVMDSTFSLNSGSIDWSTSFEKNSGMWTYKQILKNGVYCVTELYIPIDDTKSFPGGDNFTLQWLWTIDCPYTNIQYPETGALSLNAVIRDYGQLISAVDISNDTLQLNFSVDLPVDFIYNLSYIFTRNLTDSTGFKYEEEMSYVFKSIRESWVADSRKSNYAMISLQDGMVVPPGTYTLELHGTRDRSDLLGSDSDITDDAIVYSITTNINYMTSNPPNDISVEFNTTKSGFTTPVLTVNFIEPYPDIDSCKNGYLYVEKHDTGELVTECFNLAGAKYNTTEADGITYVKSIDIPMHNETALSKGTYNCNYNLRNYGKIPVSGYRSFTLSEGVITPFGRVSSANTKGTTKLIIGITFESCTYSMIPYTKAAKILGIKSYIDLFNQCTIKIINEDNKDVSDSFKSNMDIQLTNITLTLKDNQVLHPGTYKISLLYNGSIAFKEWTGDIGGLISNKIGKTGSDKICYILEETHNGKTTRSVYSTYGKCKKRIKKLEKLNKANEEDYKRCKACRKKKLISTKKIKTQIESLIIPSGKMSTAVAFLVEAYYMIIIAPSIKCPHPNFHEVMFINNQNGPDGDNFHCDHYVKKKTLWKWKVRIGTMCGSYPKTKPKKIFFEVITKNGVEIPRGFAATKKGKRSSRCKKYIKKIDAHIKQYNANVATCKKCKKCALAYKNKSKIGWKSALFPSEIQSSKFSKTIAKRFTKAYKAKKVGCKKSKFKFVKSSTSGYCRLTCENVCTTDKTLASSSFTATFKK